MDLKSIQKQVGYKILRIQEIGSFAWGYNRPTSDHDIMIVYLDDPIENMFINKKPKVQSVGDYSFVVVKWSEFLIQALKFNLNYYCYLYSNEGIYLTNTRVQKLMRYYTDLLRDNFSIQMKLTVQAVSCIQSYHDKSKTYKDLYRMAYMFWLACKFKELPRYPVEVKWDGQGDNLIYEAYNLYKQGLDGELADEHFGLFEKIWEKGSAIRMPRFSLPSIPVETYTSLFG